MSHVTAWEHDQTNIQQSSAALSKRLDDAMIAFNIPTLPAYVGYRLSSLSDL